MTREHPHVRLESADFACDDIQIRKLTGTEAISRLFDFRVEIVVLNQKGLDAAAVTGAGVTLVFESDDVELRRVHGIVCALDDLLETEAAHRTYRLRVVPRAYRFCLVETVDIFLDLSVPDIIRAKAELVALDSDIDFRLSGSYPAREFVVQYGETDLAFISRLTEHLGISFFFDHSSGADRMVFTDSAVDFRPIPRPAGDTLTFQRRGEEIGVFRLEAARQMIPRMYVVRDYNYRIPQVDLTGSFEVSGGHAGGVIEFGAHHKTPAEGEGLAQVRAEERQATELVYTGASTIPSLTAGATFAIEGHPHLADPRLLITEVEHEATQVTMLTGGGSADERPYSNTFRAIPAARTFRPPRVTPKPKIHGVVTGVVEDPTGATSGQTAMIDDEGRYTVRFLFDTAAPGERRASRPIRMAQPHAGASYGTHFPLKPGIEVLIAFVNGDPDRPVIVGAVPNPLTPSPVVDKNAKLNRIVTVSGVRFDIKDA